MDANLPSPTLAEVSRRIHARETTARQVTEALLDRIQRLNPTLNAYLHVFSDEALQEAAGLDALLAAGHDLGPLHGVPVAVKDLFAMRGLPNPAGSKILADAVAADDSTAVARLKQAGAIVLGRTNMDEFAFGGTTENAHYGVTRNPWDTGRSPGGSSGGSAAAVAARLAYAALGTDTASSIRNPAHFNGIVGLKPTYGRVSRHGVVPLAWSLDHVGPFARTVEDAALVLRAIAGSDPKDPTASRRAVPDYRQRLNEPIDGLRIGVLRGYFWEPIDDAVARAVEAALDAFRALGARVQDGVRYPYEDLLPALFQVTLSVEPAAFHLQWLQERPQDYGPAVLQRLLLGAAVPAADYVNAERVRALMKQEMHGLMRRFDVLVTPAVRYTAPLIGQTHVRIGGQEIEASLLRTRNLYPFNLLGLPAMTVPCGFDPQGLPIGVQLVGRAWDEQTVLRLGHAYQQASDWHTRSPALPP